MSTEAIRIVPLHPGPVAAPPAAPPKLTYRGGPLLTAVEVVTAFWGSSWQGSESTLVPQINAFFSYVLASPLLDQLAEFGVPNKPIGRGTLLSSANITTSQPASVVADAELEHLIQSEIANGTLPASTANTLYFLYLQPGVTVEMGGQRSCSSFCGYHDSFGSGLYYAVMPYPGCSGCVGGLSVLDALTTTSSHELCEAVTDPIPSSGWYDDANGEIGDICAWQTKRLGPWMVQLEWSNVQSRCV
jgi:hypothetical protein